MWCIDRDAENIPEDVTGMVLTQRSGVLSYRREGHVLSEQHSSIQSDVKT